ncbi:hypothetical protein [Deinococcus roseus]|uniref:DUF4884 domain-containing protein n=1 Tax=Deinococcus roseus TaxID=392414 RepID=A0ABQ2CXM3_9DEIO|nr:hypothetical protein [Deinococcus roseus]GGJ31104.1 hypothetical protein GCM10008938_16540 [Deinococcus roseus]
MKKTMVAFAVVALALVGCRSETQNQLRRQVLDFANTKQYITLYSYDGKEIFNGVVDGKVTRAEIEQSSGSYVYWFDEKGRYHQTTMPYLVSTYDRKQQ